MFNFFNLFGDESAKWAECFKTPLTLNLQYKSLNNVTLGDAYEKISVFGRPNNRAPFKNHEFVYHPLGIEIGGENGVISDFDFIMNVNESYLAYNSDLANYASCEFTLITDKGGFLPINKNTTVADIERVLGIPTEKEVDEGEIYVIYHYNRLMLDFEFRADQRIERLNVGAWD